MLMSEQTHLSGSAKPIRALRSAVIYLVGPAKFKPTLRHQWLAPFSELVCLERFRIEVRPPLRGSTANRG